SSEGGILAEIETEKATMEFESFHSGSLLYTGVQAGETADVDSELATIGEEGEDHQALLNGDTKEEKSTEETDEKATEDKSPVENEELADQNPSQEEQVKTTEVPAGVEIITMPRLSDTM